MLGRSSAVHYREATGSRFELNPAARSGLLRLELFELLADLVFLLQMAEASIERVLIQIGVGLGLRLLLLDSLFHALELGKRTRGVNAGQRFADTRLGLRSPAAGDQQVLFGLG